jgi:putative transposase
LIPNQDACENIFIKGKEMHLQQLSKAIGKTLSSYAQTINGVKNRRGNLFQKKTKARILTSDKDTIPFSDSDLLINYMEYIHYIPVEAGLCKSPLEWEMSSARDYAGLRKSRFCNKELLAELTAKRNFESENLIFNRELTKRIY